MQKQEIMELLNKGENRKVEFTEAKKELPKSLWKTYSSFANTEGRSSCLGYKRKQRKV